MNQSDKTGAQKNEKNKTFIKYFRNHYLISCVMVLFLNAKKIYFLSYLLALTSSNYKQQELKKS
jgi:hypothetical protein